MPTNESTVDELTDLFAIQDVVFGYTHAIDGRDEALFDGLWAADAVWEFLGEGAPGAFEGHDAIMEGFRATTGSGRQMHHCSSNLVVELDGTRARGRSKSVTTGQALPLFVVYDDEFVRVDGRWRLQRREVRARL